MAKKVTAIVKLQCPAGAANPSKLVITEHAPSDVAAARRAGVKALILLLCILACSVRVTPTARPNICPSILLPSLRSSGAFRARAAPADSSDEKRGARAPAGGSGR